MNRKRISLNAVLTALFTGNIVVLVRHGCKDGEHVSAKCLTEITEKGITGIDPKLITHFAAGSMIVRSTETVLAYMIHVAKRTGKYCPISFPPSVAFGATEMFKDLFPETVQKEMKKKGLTNLEGAKLGEKFSFYQNAAKKEMEKLLEYKSPTPDKRAVIFTASHSPIVEMLAEAYGGHTSSVRELEGWCFVSSPAGKIFTYPL